MRVAVTGASGFIGAALVERHRLQGDAVRVLSRSTRRWPEGVEVHVADLTDAGTDAQRTLQRFAAGAAGSRPALATAFAHTFTVSAALSALALFAGIALTRVRPADTQPDTRRPA